MGDKVRPATSDMVIACKGQHRYFDLDAVRTEHSEPIRENVNRPKRQQENGCRGSGGDDRGYVLRTGNPAGAPPLDHWWFDDVFEQDAWLIPTEPYKGSHYATWPTELLKRPILAMCPPGGVVLDPFAGSGTTLAVATGHGRDAIGIDLDERNATLASERVGMFLTIEHHSQEGAA